MAASTAGTWIQVILASAAVGAIVSSLVQLIAGNLERKHREAMDRLADRKAVYIDALTWLYDEPIQATSRPGRAADYAVEVLRDFELITARLAAYGSKESWIVANEVSEALSRFYTAASAYWRNNPPEASMSLGDRIDTNQEMFRNHVGEAKDRFVHLVRDELGHAD